MSEKTNAAVSAAAFSFLIPPIVIATKQAAIIDTI